MTDPFDAARVAYEAGQRDALDAVLSDINARLQREGAEGDPDGLRDGLLYFVEVLERQIKGDSDA